MGLGLGLGLALEVPRGRHPQPLDGRLVAERTAHCDHAAHAEEGLVRVRVRVRVRVGVGVRVRVRDKAWA